VKIVNNKNFNIKELSEKYPMFISYYDYLKKKYNNRFSLNSSELMQELEISNTTFYGRKKKGKNLPDYIQENEMEKGSISFPLVCIAAYKASGYVKLQ